MIFKIYHRPVASEQIACQGAVLNGRASLSDALQIPQANRLLANIADNIQPKLDSVLASHRGWQTDPKSR